MSGLLWTVSLGRLLLCMLSHGHLSPRPLLSLNTTAHIPEFPERAIDSGRKWPVRLSLLPWKTAQAPPRPFSEGQQPTSTGLPFGPLQRAVNSVLTCLVKQRTKCSIVALWHLLDIGLLSGSAFFQRKYQLMFLF